MLTDRITLSGTEDISPEDILSSSLGVIFPDDITNQHGDSEHQIIYTSPTLGSIHLSLADPQGEDNRRLFSHYLWNAGVQLAQLIEDDPEWPVANKRVIELGAGTGLSGMVAALKEAREVVITDYPAPEVLANIRGNVERNVVERSRRSTVIRPCLVEGHEWGIVGDKLSEGLQESGHSVFTTENREAFDRVLVADCLWMPWQHKNLMQSIRWFLAPEGRAWVVAGFHTGRLKMAGFFDKQALSHEQLEVEKVWERDAQGIDREWVSDRGIEDVTERKRWLVIAILKRKR